MTAAGWAQLIALIVLIGVTAPLLGRYMANVYQGGPSRLDRVFGPVERLIYRACRIDPKREQRWNVYALSVLAFSVVGTDDGVAAAHERDAQREERQDQEQYPHVSHGSPRPLMEFSMCICPDRCPEKGPDDLLTPGPAGLTARR